MPIDSAVRMSQLQALFDHPRTGNSERDVEQRMLNRLFRSMRSTAGGARQYGSNHGRLGRHAGRDGVACVSIAWGWQHDDGIDVHSPALSTPLHCALSSPRSP